jgi:hypothetical protein
MEELAGYVYVAEEPEAYVEVLRSLDGLETEGRARARIEQARKNSWEVRFKEIEEALWHSL